MLLRGQISSSTPVSNQWSFAVEIGILFTENISSWASGAKAVLVAFMIRLDIQAIHETTRDYHELQCAQRLHIHTDFNCLYQVMMVVEADSEAAESKIEWQEIHLYHVAQG